MKRNPEGKRGTLHIYRGGDAFTRAIYCRSAFRYRFTTSHVVDTLGLRPVLVPKKKNEKEHEKES